MLITVDKVASFSFEFFQNEKWTDALRLGMAIYQHLMPVLLRNVSISSNLHRQMDIVRLWNKKTMQNVLVSNKLATFLFLFLRMHLCLCCPTVIVGWDYSIINCLFSAFLKNHFVYFRCAYFRFIPLRNHRRIALCAGIFCVVAFEMFHLLYLESST